MSNLKTIITRNLGKKPEAWEFDYNRLIDQGAYSRIYQGYLKSDPKFKVAIKEIICLPPNQDEKISEAWREILILTSIPEHENVLKYFGFADE